MQTNQIEFNIEDEIVKLELKTSSLEDRIGFMSNKIKIRQRSQELKYYKGKLAELQSKISNQDGKPNRI